MSKYTTELRFICESKSGLSNSVGFNQIDDVISNSWNKIFDNFPIFDESYRSVLCSKILKHYYTREISAETVGLWQLWLNTRMGEIMPYYNKLYESALLEFDPFKDTNYSRNHGGTFTGDTRRNGRSDVSVDNSVTSNGTSNSKNLFSDTPQGAITNIENESYLTNATLIKDTDTNTTNTDGNSTTQNTETTGITNTDNWIETIVGKQSDVSYSKLLQEFRDTFLNIDVMIINDLSDLFMNLWYKG